MVNLSAATLIKKTASQLVYEIEHKTVLQPTQRMLRGSLSATIATKDSRFAELGGFHGFQSNMGPARIYFAIDEIQETPYEVIAIEHKYIEGTEIPEWFLNNSLLQVGLYLDLCNNISQYRGGVKALTTAKFHCETLGIDPRTFVIPNKPLVGKLQFNGDVKDAYLVELHEEYVDDILNFYKGKVNAANSSMSAQKKYQTAKAFDNAYKRKEWDLLSKCIRVTKVPYEKDNINFTKYSEPTTDTVDITSACITDLPFTVLPERYELINTGETTLWQENQTPNEIWSI